MVNKKYNFDKNYIGNVAKLGQVTL